MMDFGEQAINATLKSIRSGGVDLHAGDSVRLRPRRKADIFDLALAGKVAVIEAIEQDLEGNVFLAVVLEDDPGRDLGMLRQTGHRFFFALEEIEPMVAPAEAGPSLDADGAETEANNA